MTDTIMTIQSPKGTLWRVPLPNNPHYPYTLFHRRLGDEYNYTVVTVDVEKFLECHSRDTGYAIPPFDDWNRDEVDGLMNFMRPSIFDPLPEEDMPRFVREALGENRNPGSVEMPITHIEMRRYVERSGWLELKAGSANTEFNLIISVLFSR
ncbi:MAG TPA: hypothetical protein VJ577_03520 [Burkholderiaceae bacterium]|nr:hypothetical protein [Burkholderiaceae bacterium]